MQEDVMPGGGWPVFLGAWLLMLAACASAGGHHSPSTDELADRVVVAQRELGETLYRERCRACHEEEDGIGKELSPRLLASYFSARNLYDYIALAMPHDDPGSLSDEAYWAVTAYLILDWHLARLDVPLAPGIADSIRLSSGRPE